MGDEVAKKNAPKDQGIVEPRSTEMTAQGQIRAAQRLLNTEDESRAETLGRLMADPGINAADVMCKYPLGRETKPDMMSSLRQIDLFLERVRMGDLTDVASMLSAQALATQAVWRELVTRAAGQTNIESIEILLRLAFKAQSQSRATLATLIDLKSPRTTVIAKQANLANQQQVNNGSKTQITLSEKRSRSRKSN